jgi:thiol-disulfide isomerase/thioredoxin
MKNMIINTRAGMSSTVIAVTIGIVVIAGIAYFATMRDDSAYDAIEKSEDAMMKEDAMKDGDAMEKEGDAMEKSGEAMDDGAMMDSGAMIKYAGTVIAGTQTKLIDFNRADYEKALASDQLIVLYFYASWCPICREETQNALYPAFNELATDVVVGFRVNYNDSDTDDAEKALAREFGVAYQHTKVFLKNGTRVLKSPETWSKARYLSEISNAI